MKNRNQRDGVNPFSLPVLIGSLSLVFAVRWVSAAEPLVTVDVSTSLPSETVNVVLARDAELLLVTPHDQAVEVGVVDDPGTPDLRLAWRQGFSVFYDGQWMRVGHQRMPTVYGKRTVQCRAEHHGKRIEWYFRYRQQAEQDFLIRLKMGPAWKAVIRVSRPEPANPVVSARPAERMSSSALPGTVTVREQFDAIDAQFIRPAEEAGASGGVLWERAAKALQQMSGQVPGMSAQDRSEYGLKRGGVYLALGDDRRAAESFMEVLRIDMPTAVVDRQQAEMMAARIAAAYQLQKIRHVLSDEEAGFVDGH